MQKLDSLSRRWKMKSSSDMMLGLTSGKNEASLSISWWKSVSASLSLMFWVFWKSTFKNHWGWQEVTLIIILQDWQFAIFPFDFTVTFFLHDVQERLFEACWTPIILPDTFLCVSDSISVVTCAKSCVKDGISLKRNCYDFGVLRYRDPLDSLSLRFCKA